MHISRQSCHTVTAVTGSQGREERMEGAGDVENVLYVRLMCCADPEAAQAKHHGVFPLILGMCQTHIWQ